MKTYWLSFVKQGKNAGICIVTATSSINAVKKSHRVGINPGGEVAIWELPNTQMAIDEVKKWGRNKLIEPKYLFKEGYETIQTKGKGI